MMKFDFGGDQLRDGLLGIGDAWGWVSNGKSIIDGTQWIRLLGDEKSIIPKERLKMTKDGGSSANVRWLGVSKN